jgi:hypothetical protein
MTPDEITALRAEVQTIKESVNRIESALVGDQKLGHTGFAERLALVEKQTAEHDKKLILWGGIATGASVAITKFWHTITG